MTCYRCKGPALDLRGCAFNPAALEVEGTCYLWKGAVYTCNNPPIGRRDMSKEAFLNCWVYEEADPRK